MHDRACVPRRNARKATANRCAAYSLCKHVPAFLLTGQIDIARSFQCTPSCLRQQSVESQLGEQSYPYHGRSSPMVTLPVPDSTSLVRHG